MKIIDCEQGTDAWYRARMGVPTASEFSTVLASGRGNKESVTRRRYLCRLAGERLTGMPGESYTNAHMERGHEWEPAARADYALINDVDPKLVGFVTNDDGTAGCSPDALVGDDGTLEIKSALPHILIDFLDKDKFPAEHVPQTQGALWITERDWVDLAVYHPGLPMFIKRAYRDEEYIAKLADAVEKFNDEIVSLVERIAHYGEPTGGLKSKLQDSLLMAG